MLKIITVLLAVAITTATIAQTNQAPKIKAGQKIELDHNFDIQKPKGPPKILDSEQRKALSRITSKGFIVGQKDLPDGRKELTWTNGKDTVVTTQKIERVNGGKAKDARRAELDAVKAEKDSLKAENDKLKKAKK